MPTRLEIEKPKSPAFYTEAPPWLLNVPGFPRTAFLAPTSYAAIAQADHGLSTDLVRVASASIVTDVEAAKPWAHSYNAAWTAFTTDGGTARQRLYFVAHGENKNEIGGTGPLASRRPVPGTVGRFPIAATDPNSWSGYREDGSYGDGYAAYFQFVSLSFVDSNAGNGFGLASRATDLGPIVWPAEGYLHADGSKAGDGVGQPTVVDDGSYVYVYYRDGSLSDDGEMVARAPIADLRAAPDADKTLQFRTYCGERGWLPSLPAGFRKDAIAAFWQVPGPPAVPVLFHHQYRGRLAVAKVTGQLYALAVGQYSLDGRTWTVALYRTTDLVHFEEVGILLHGGADDAQMLNYPVLMNAAGTSQTMIELDDFYVVGTAFRAGAPALKMHLTHGAFALP